MRRCSILKALVTGGSTGIGRSIVEALSVEGHRVTYTSTKRLEDPVEGARHVCMDFLSEESVSKALSLISGEEWDIVVNNAGINDIQSIDCLTDDVWDRILSVNLTGALKVSSAVSDGMCIRGFGRIINIGSILGSVSKSKRAAYSASKSGLSSFTKELALSVAKYGVTVNNVCPGFTETRLTRKILTSYQIDDILSSVPLKRMAEPKEIAQVVLFLASTESAHITGQDIVVDGGFCAQ